MAFDYEIRDNICPVCGGSRDPKHEHCWHCLDCEFTQCANTKSQYKYLLWRYNQGKDWQGNPIKQEAHDGKVAED